MAGLGLGGLFQPQGLEIPALRIWDSVRGEVTGQGQRSAVPDPIPHLPPALTNSGALGTLGAPGIPPPCLESSELLRGTKESFEIWSREGLGGLEPRTPFPNLLFLAAQSYS